jgi:hypothetical protein
MSSRIRLAIGAAVVVAAVVIGINVLPAGKSDAGPSNAGTSTTGPMAAITPSATPPPTPAPPSASAIPTLQPVEGGVPLAPGTYLVPKDFPVPITVTVPSGWSGDAGWPYAAFLSKHGEGNGVELEFSVSQSLYLDPCDGSRGQLTGLGDTVADFAGALAALPHLQATTPTQVTLDGISGTQLTLTAPAQADRCPVSPQGYAIWQLPLGAVTSILPGQHMTNWIADVDGQRLVLSTWTSEADAAQDDVELAAILASVHFVSQP